MFNGNSLLDHIDEYLAFNKVFYKESSFRLSNFKMDDWKISKRFVDTRAETNDQEPGCSDQTDEPYRISYQDMLPEKS